MPLPGVEVAFGENGVLLVKGPNVMMGYWNNPGGDRARCSTPTGWLDTGDQARMEDGFLYITGRIKEIIVLGNGEKVPPVDMELAIQLDPLFEQVMVVGEGKPYLAALVVLERAAAAKARQLDEKALAARIAPLLKGFPGYAQVRRVAVVDGAVDRGQRPAHADAQAAARADPRAPRGARGGDLPGPRTVGARACRHPGTRGIKRVSSVQRTPSACIVPERYP